MSSLLDGLDATADVKEDGDFLGGFSPFESDLYTFTVKLAYFTVSAGGAKCLNVTFKDANDRELKQQFWITSGTAKGCLPYYINQKTLEKHFLPGFTAAKHLALLTTGKEISKLTLEDKHIKLYSYDAKAEVATSVPMCVEMLGKPIICGVVKRLTDATKDSGTVDAAGKKIYSATGEVKIENEVVKLFHARDKRTVTEILAKATEAEFADKWLKKWKGNTEDKTSKQSGVAGKATAAATASTASGVDLGALFV